MKFELVEPPEPASGLTEAPSSDSAPDPDAPPWAGPRHEVLAARMRDRSEGLGTRLTSIIEAVRPAMNRMEASIVRTERELADTGHDFSAEPPATFRADRFAGSAATPATSEENGS